MAGNLNCDAWLRNLSDDPDPAAANVYFTVTRGFAILSPEAAAAFKPQSVSNYGSALEHSDAVDAEIERLLSRFIIDDWDVIVDELGLPAGTQPTMLLALGAVLKKGKTRLLIDGSAPYGVSINDNQDPPDTVLPNIAMAMAAMTQHGYLWKSDYSDAFCQHPLAESSLTLCVIEWRGKLYGFRRLGFGFRSGPSQQQSTTVSVVRALNRRLRAAGLHTVDPPAMDHRYPTISAAPEGMHSVNALLAFLDDLGGFCSSKPAAWFSFAHYLALCKELSLVVAMKDGKTDEPRTLLRYIGFDCCTETMTISLHPERVAELRVSLAAVLAADSITVGTALSLVGTLVFCSTVIRIGRTHYRALIDAVTALGPRKKRQQKVEVSAAMREGIDMWLRLLTLLNARSASCPALRPTVPQEATTDASLTGWAWEGMGAFDHGPWPSDWAGSLGRATRKHPELKDGLRRIFICECEIWAVLFLCRHLCPRCVGSRLTIRVDNLPVVRMLNKLSTRSAACLPILREICWICATFDVELDVTWIDTKSNIVADLLSRKFSPDHDQAAYDAVLATLAVYAADPEWRRWKRQRAARPELQAHIPVADPADFSTEWGALDAVEMRRILPHYDA